MKLNIASITSAVAASSLLIGASVWAQSDQGSQAGQSGQWQSGSSGQSGTSQSDQSSQSGQSGQMDNSGQQSSQMGKGSTTSEAASAEIQRITQDPQEFIQHAYQNNLTEIQLGKLAAKNGQSQEVKDFGEHLIQGHQALNEKLTKLASQKNITLSKQLDARHQSMIDNLQALSGAAFDKQFTGQQVLTHRRDVGLYQRAAQNNTDSDVKSFAQTSLPALREHLQMAQQQATAINEAAGAQKEMNKDQYQQKGQQGQDQQPQQPQEQPQPQQQP